MQFEVDCDRPLEDIYEEIMKHVKVCFFLSKSILLLILNSISSLGSVAREKGLRLYTKMRDPRRNRSNAVGRGGEAEGL